MLPRASSVSFKPILILGLLVKADALKLQLPDSVSPDSKVNVTWIPSPMDPKQFALYATCALGTVLVAPSVDTAVRSHLVNVPDLHLV
ncbi:hypothetical protein C0995_000707 [Termitomyces sp. Mi166|nr:hypothetical protein C0995_000707 [Termitomyces sp. Mi166\